MSSLRRFFRTPKPYDSKAKLLSMTPEQIVRLDPKLVSSHIEDDNTQLSRSQAKALTRLLAIKQQMKQYPNLNREKAITDFLVRENLSNQNIVDSTNSKMKEQIQMKDLTNRLNKLNNKPVVPDTEEEALYRRIMALEKGGSKKRTKRHRKHKTNRRRYKKGIEII